MKLLEHIWNYQIGGVLGALSFAAAILFRKIHNFFTTILIKNNFHKTGKRVRIHRGIYYQNPSHITLGNDVLIHHHAHFVTESETGILEIADNVQINEHCWIDFSGSVRVGSNTLISKNVTIETHNHGLDPHSKPECKSLDIGKKVWIGMGSIILVNARTIGDNSIIAAGSVVTKPVAENCIVAGNPARIIKKISIIDRNQDYKKPDDNINKGTF